MNARAIHTAVILAGGQGTRLRNAVPQVPKALAPVRGRPFLFYILDQLMESAITQVILCVGYRAQQIRQALGFHYRGLSLIYSEEPTPMGTAGALRLASPYLCEEFFLVLNGDTFLEFEIEDFFSWHMHQKARASVLLSYRENASGLGHVLVNSAGEIQAFCEKKENSGPGWVNAGAYLFDRAFLNSIPPDRPISLERETLPLWVQKGLFGYQTHVPFIDIGTTETYSLAKSRGLRAVQ